MDDSLHDWNSRNLDLVSSRKWIKRGLSLEWFSSKSSQDGKKEIC